MYHKNLYFVNYNTTLPDTSETNIAFFKNVDGNKDFEVYEALVSADSAVTVMWKFGDAYSSGGVAVAPINSNRTSGATLPTSVATVYEGGASGDLVLTETNRIEFHKAWLAANAFHVVAYDGGLVLGNGNSLTITATGAANDEINVTLLMAWHAAGTEL